jgi:hypothetical protein
MTTVETILSKLGRVRRNGNGWIARCPAHKDLSPSLSICERAGKILLHCHAGCSVQSICTALGIRLRDLFSESTARRRAPERPIIRAARRVASEGLQHHHRSVRDTPVTVIFTEAADVDTAIARALALTVEGELVQLALAGSGENQCQSVESKK